MLPEIAVLAEYNEGGNVLSPVGELIVDLGNPEPLSSLLPEIGPCFLDGEELLIGSTV